jgi:hypothetical protein
MLKSYLPTFERDDVVDYFNQKGAEDHGIGEACSTEDRLPHD